MWGGVMSTGYRHHPSVGLLSDKGCGSHDYCLLTSPFERRQVLRRRELSIGSLRRKGFTYILNKPL